MTTLLERCQSTTVDLAKIEVARQTAHQRATLQQRVSEWVIRIRDIERALDVARWADLKSEGNVECITALKQFRRNVASAAERVSSGEDPTALTADALWNRLVLSAEKYAASLVEASKSAWARQVETQGALETPTQLGATVAAIPSNQVALTTYGKHHANYRRLADQALPRTADDLDLLRNAVRGCREELQKIQHDVPEDVAAFFRAVYSNAATLSCLTPTVLEWLRNNGQLDRYSIRSSGQ